MTQQETITFILMRDKETLKRIPHSYFPQFINSIIDELNIKRENEYLTTELFNDIYDSVVEVFYHNIEPEFETITEQKQFDSYFNKNNYSFQLIPKSSYRDKTIKSLVFNLKN